MPGFTLTHTLLGACMEEKTVLQEKLLKAESEINHLKARVEELEQQQDGDEPEQNPSRAGT